MTQVRRTPSQERSREKVEAILASAKQLIGEKGNDAVSVREIAKHAGIGASTMYQYFPDKNAILLALMGAYFDELRSEIKAALEPVSNIEDFQVAIEQVMDTFYLQLHQDPSLATLWSAVQANTVLRDFDAEDTVKVASLLANKLKAILPRVSKDDAYYAGYLFLEMGGMLSRRTLTMNAREGERLMQELKLLVSLRLGNLSSL